jgi:amidohydrolase
MAGDRAQALIAGFESELTALRRDLHAHPELGHDEQRTTDVVARRLERAGLRPQRLPVSGLWCDIGAELDGETRRATARPTVLLRADLDALPLDDPKRVGYRSQTPGVCHACGHDVHTAVLVGAALALGELAHRDGLPGRVRLVFQPAEELMPGGAHEVIDAGLLEQVDLALALHCDPSLEVGRIGLRTGPITAASDQVAIHLRGPGGHTSRPHNTVDLVYALGRLITELPAALNRVIDPRAAVTLVWGMVNAGSAANAIPMDAVARGTCRVLHRDTWAMVPEIVERLARQIVAPYGATLDIEHRRGVPPVVNDPVAVAVLEGATEAAFGADARTETSQSLGGEDFGWYLEHVPGAMARLGVRHQGTAPYDLHQPGFDVDERCIGIGARLLTEAALQGLADLGG